MYEIYTYGGREFIENIFTGIALFFNPANSYLAMMKSLVKVGLIILLFAWIWHAFSHERGEAEDEGRLASIGLVGLVKIGILSAFVLYIFLNPVRRDRKGRGWVNQAK